MINNETSMRHSYADVTKDKALSNITKLDNDISVDQNTLTIMERMLERFEMTIERMVNKMMDCFIDLISTKFFR